MGEEVPQAAKAKLPSGVDKIVRAAYKAVQVLLEVSRRAIGPRGAKISSRLPVKKTEIAQVIAAQRLYAVAFHPSR